MSKIKLIYRQGPFAGMGKPPRKPAGEFTVNWVDDKTGESRPVRVVFFDKNIYFTAEGARAGKPFRWSSFAATDTRSIHCWVEVEPGCFGGASCHVDPASAVERIEYALQRAGKDFFAEMGEIARSPDKAQARQKEEFERDKAARERERELLAADRARVLAKEQAQAEEFLRQAGVAFMGGAKIDWNDFEGLCAKHGVALHPRSIGSGRKNIHKIGKETAKVYATGRKYHVPAAVWAAAGELVLKLEGAGKT